MIKDAFNKLDSWVMKNGWQGYDPYDIKGTKLFLPLQKNKYTSFGSQLFLNRFPMFFRKVFRIKREVNAKAMALFARGYLNCYRKGGDEKYLKKGLACLDWLIENPSRDYSGYCWGYPFDWQSRIFIPKETPSGVVTSITAHAFLDAYEELDDKKYLNLANSCCNFIMNDLNIDKVEDDMICFSYTPLDGFHVHNANLFSSSTLLRTYQCLKNEKYKELGKLAINFTMGHQKEDGSWYYWAPPDKVLEIIDNYHTGFVLECLNTCRRTLGKDFGYLDELKKGLVFYAKNLFFEDRVPKMTHESIYPIDIHSCAQGIITFCEVADFDPKYLKLAKRIAEWTINNMQDDEGYFYYRIYRKGYVDKMPYIRWGQAWMLRALSYLVHV
jgi:uncharacterized protein YyaL (SSP411 family)